ncbi:MAG: COX15/CtaA family protein [Methylacidiphilales bacterium]|nr:COX15/CtaA family protein [Candidatus Methylacidiphilales bacterium]
MNYSFGAPRLFWIVAFILSITIIVLGITTRLFDAGLSCPDWPLCYGKVTLVFDETVHQEINQGNPDVPYDLFRVSLEFIHRALATLLGLISVGLLLYRVTQKLTFSFHPSFLLILVASQGVFGMYTVTLSLVPWVIVVHLLLGYVTVSYLWALSVSSVIQRHKLQFYPMWVSRGLLICILVLVIQIGLGGLVTATGASLACVGFPECNQYFIPPLELNADILFLPATLEQLQTIHFIHRVFAFIVTTILILYMVLVFRLCAMSHINSQNPLALPNHFQWKPLRQGLLLLASLLALQWLLGVLNVVIARPYVVALLHSINGLTMVLLLLFLYIKITPQKRSLSDLIAKP